MQVSEVSVAHSMLQRMRDAPQEYSAREKVQAMEHEICKSPEAIYELPVFHHFSFGLYARELHIKKGMITVGKIHKYPCLNILAKGDRSTLIDGQLVRIKAPHVHVAPAGMKRISYSHEDSVWITVHATQETELDKLEEELVANTEQEYQDFCKAIEMDRQKCLG
jgi:hypothetical protein